MHWRAGCLSQLLQDTLSAPPIDSEYIDAPTHGSMSNRGPADDFMFFALSPVLIAGVRLNVSLK